MANTPDEPELVFHVRHMPGGRTSAYVATQLKAGDKVKVSGPLGVVLPARRPPRARCCSSPAAAGSRRSSRSCAPCSSAATPRRCALYFGVRSERDLYHEALLKDLAARHPNFTYQVVLSEQKGARGPPLRPGARGDRGAADAGDRDGLPRRSAGDGGSRDRAARRAAAWRRARSTPTRSTTRA